MENTQTQSDFCCPKCKSNDTKRIKILYEGGTVKSSGTAESNNHNTVHINSESTTALADRYSPPSEPSGYIYHFFAAAIQAALVSGIVMVILFTFFNVTGLLDAKWLKTENGTNVLFAGVFWTSVAIICIWSLKTQFGAKKGNEIEHDEEIKSWNQTMENGYLCSRCGHEFVL